MANVLVIGSGGREHALCWQLRKSPAVKTVYCAPGNAGIAQDAKCVTLESPSDIIDFCQTKKIKLVVVGPEQPLVEGLADQLSAVKIPVFGPSAKAARLEGSKAFTKNLCQKYKIPTADYGEFSDAESAKKYLKGKTYPVVVKADGLAGGKGVIIAESAQEASAAIDSILGGSFGDAGKRLIIEEFLTGEEVSFFALCDGHTAVPFGYAQDHKRAFDGDQGPNTGGMGTYSPTPALKLDMIDTVMDEIVLPTVQAMKKEGAPFKGVLFAGLMITKKGPKLLEYNARFGDPETQVLMARFKGDLYELLLSCANGKIDTNAIAFHDATAICVVMASKGYPGPYAKGSVIRGLDAANRFQNVKIFHAGTQKKGTKIIAAGGRVLGVTAVASDIVKVQALAYKAVDAIDWPDGFCRRDIGWRALKR